MKLLWVALLIGLAAACTDDFDAFAFDGLPNEDSAPDGGDTGDTGDIGDTPNSSDTGDGHTTGTGDGDGDGDGDATVGDGDGDVVGNGSGDTDPGGVGDMDAGSGDPTDPGAGDMACDTVFAPLTPDGLPECAGCGCGTCSAELSACLTGGDDADNTLCQAVLECGLDHGCSGWDCYCEQNNCGGGSESGDGPCAAAIDAATGGDKDAWDSIRGSGDGTEPLVRALDAIFCTLGAHKKSTGGPTTGTCASECSP